MTLFRGALLAVIGCLPACTDPGLRGVPGVRVVPSDQVAGCTFVTNLRARPPVYGPGLADQGVRYARNTVLAAAQADGANTVVFDTVEPGAPVFEVTGTAYRC